MADEDSTFEKDRSIFNQQLVEHFMVDLQNFDLITTTSGLNLLEIVEATKDSYMDSPLHFHSSQSVNQFTSNTPL